MEKQKVSLLATGLVSSMAAQVMALGGQPPDLVRVLCYAAELAKATASDNTERATLVEKVAAQAIADFKEHWSDSGIPKADSAH